MPPHERERPRHRVGRLGRLVPERVMSPGPRPKCVRRDQAPRRTSAYIYGVERSACVVETHPLTEPLIQTGRRSIVPGTLRPFLCVECTGWHASQCSPAPLVAINAQGHIGLEDSLGASAPVRHVPQPPRERPLEPTFCATQALHCAMVGRTQSRPIAKICRMLRRNKQQNRLTSRNVMDQTAAIPDLLLDDS